jgi:fimbrial chaperone protein
MRLCSAAMLLVCASVPAYSSARAQGIEVVPVNVQLAPGQQAATLTVTNRNHDKVSFQVRGFRWQQDGQGNDTLAPTDALMSSPPIATVQPGASQVVRLVLRQPPQGGEATYRVVFDQLPSPNEPGMIHVLIRLSIPVFAEPASRVAPDVHWRIANDADRWWLIATNAGTRHLTVSKMKLEGSGGRELQVEVNSPPHILAGATRRWPIEAKSGLSPNEVVHLTAEADFGSIDQRITIDTGP